MSPSNAQCQPKSHVKLRILPVRVLLHETEADFYRRRGVEKRRTLYVMSRNLDGMFVGNTDRCQSQFSGAKMLGEQCALK